MRHSSVQGMEGTEILTAVGLRWPEWLGRSAHALAPSPACSTPELRPEGVALCPVPSLNVSYQLSSKASPASTDICDADVEEGRGVKVRRSPQVLELEIEGSENAEVIAVAPRVPDVQSVPASIDICDTDVEEQGRGARLKRPGGVRFGHLALRTD